MAKKKRIPMDEVLEFNARLRAHLDRGEDFEAALEAIEAEEEQAQRSGLKARRDALRRTLRQYEDTLRNLGFVRRVSQNDRNTYALEASQEHEVVLIFISDGRGREIEWSHRSPKVGMPTFGKDPRSLDNTLSFHYGRRVIQLGPSPLGTE